MAVDDSYTKILHHFDGDDESQTFVDESGKTWTAAGNAQLDTSEKKFGSAAGLFDGTGDYIYTADHDDFTLGNNNFTVDCWIKRASVAAGAFGIFGHATASGDGSIFCEIISTTIYAEVNTSAASEYVYAGTVNDTNWHHIAMVRNGGTLSVYLDGTNVGSDDTTLGTYSVVNSSENFVIGRMYSPTDAYYWNGRIEEFRFTNGTARWTANFTPPVAPYGGGIAIPVFMRQYRQRWG